MGSIFSSFQNLGPVLSIFQFVGHKTWHRNHIALILQNQFYHLEALCRYKGVCLHLHRFLD
jgi:hypothetical protein